MEDETGISNAVGNPELYEQERPLVIGGKFLHVEGRLQNDNGTVDVRAEWAEWAEWIEGPGGSRAPMRSQDFH